MFIGQRWREKKILSSWYIFWEWMFIEERWTEEKKLSSWYIFLHLCAPRSSNKSYRTFIEQEVQEKKNIIIVV